jgi:hypothetical protein
MTTKLEMFETSEEISISLHNMTNHMIAMATPNYPGAEPTMPMALSLASTLAAMVYVGMRGNLNEGEAVGEAVKQAIISTLGVYKDMGRINVPQHMSRAN